MRHRGVAAGLGALLVIVLGAYGVAGIARVRQMRQDITALEHDLAALRTQAEQLARTVDRLHNDPGYIEKLAREERGLVREGEQVLKFPAKAR